MYVQFVQDGVFKAELNEFFTRELAEDGYSGVEVRVTPTRTEIIILATRTQNVLGEKGRRIRELTSVVQKRFNFPEGTVELYAEKVGTRGLSAIAQAESLRYKLIGGLAVRRYVSVLSLRSIFVRTALTSASWPSFWATICKTVRPMLSDCCRGCPVSVCPVCDVAELWPNGGTDPDETWHAGRPWPWPHCVRWGHSSPFPKGHSPPPIFGPYLLWPNVCMDQDATWYGGRPWPRRFCVRWGPSPSP